MDGVAECFWSTMFSWWYVEWSRSWFGPPIMSFLKKGWLIDAPQVIVVVVSLTSAARIEVSTDH